MSNGAVFSMVRNAM